MSSNKFIRLNVVFQPPTEMVKAAISLSRKINKDNESFFVLDGIMFYPHITIYSPKYPMLNRDVVSEMVKNIAMQFSKLSFKFKEIKSHQGFIGINFQNTPQIKEIHKKIVESLNPLREEHIRDKYERDDCHVRYSIKQQKNIKLFGYPDVLDLYQPHLAIIRLKDESMAKEIAKEIKWKSKEFFVSKLAIYTMGEHGTCSKLVSKSSLRT